MSMSVYVRFNTIVVTCLPRTGTVLRCLVAKVDKAQELFSNARRQTLQFVIHSLGARRREAVHAHHLLWEKGGLSRVQALVLFSRYAPFA
jgi:hypothetical protein